MPVFDVAELEKSCAAVFGGAGLDAEESQRVAHSLVMANLMGHDSHGVIRVVQYLSALRDGKVKAGQRISVIKEADASAVVDGGWGFGQTVCHQAMALAMDKARTRSVAVVELFNCSHIGRLGEYVEVAAEQSMIGIVMCNNHGGGLLQPPFGGIETRMSPNPIAVGIPTGRAFPIVVDLTTSVVAEGKIRVKRNRGETLPEGWVIDADGNPTTDPAKFYGPPRGAILPFGGISAHKGYALSVAVDVLSGALGGSGTSREGGVAGGNGVFMMVIDIAAFTGPDAFREEMETFIDYLKSSRLMPGFDEILMPGEMEARMRQQKEAEGVYVDDETWRQICEAGQSVGVTVERVKERIMASIKITLLGHASIKLEPDSGEVFFFDPWLDQNPTCELSLADVDRADVVIASHGHNDHLGDSFALCQKTGAAFVGNYELCLVAEKHGMVLGEDALPMNPGGTVSVKGGRITATQAFHSLSMSPNQALGAAPDDAYFRPDGAVCGAVMDFDNGITVYDTSDTTVFSDMQLISQMYGPQVAILPVGGKFTMGVREAARAASLIRADIVIPCHYGDTLGQPADIAALSEAVRFLSPNTHVVKLDPGQSVTYTTSSYTVG